MVKQAFGDKNLGQTQTYDGRTLMMTIGRDGRQLAPHPKMSRKLAI
jgi:hypothetical protein